MTVCSRLLPSAVLMLAVAACSGSPDAPPPATRGGKRVDAATAGALAGRVVFEGTPPTTEPVRMTSDPGCVADGTPNPVSEALMIGGDKGVRNAFVYIKSGVDSAYSFDTPTEPVVLDQVGCIYTPRVIGVRVGQPLKVINSDTTMHNVHALPVKNREFNRSTQFKGSNISETFTTPEVPVRFMCNVHGWMAAWVGVVEHPFFAVTDASGAFSMNGVPPGTYTVEVWHETLGTQTQTITIGEKQHGSLSFTFDQAQ